MFLLTLSIDEFMQLSARDHRVTLTLFDAEIRRRQALLQGSRPGHDGYQENVDALASLRSVRKVHQGRLEELETKAAVPVAAEVSHAHAA